MRALFTTTQVERLGGAENLLSSFLSHVDRARLEPMVVFFGSGPFVEEVGRLGLRTATIAAPDRVRRLRPLAANAIRLARIIRRERPDVIVHALTMAQIHGAPGAVLAGAWRRSVWWQHDVASRQRVPDRIATVLPARAVVTFSAAADRAQRSLPPRRTVVTVLPGIDAPTETASASRRTRRAALGIPEERLTVGIVGRLIPWKGQDALLEALARLHRAGHDVHGLIVGGNVRDLAPGYPELLSRRASELGIGDRVTLTGHVPSPADYIALMDVAVNASAQEPFGLVLLEAMALAVPVLAVDAAGPRQIVAHAASGWLVASNAPESLAAGIERLIVDPALRSRLGRAGHERWRACFTAQRMTTEMVQQLERLVTPR